MTTNLQPASRARAPGKVILSGEHAVVYGRPGLIMAVDLYAETAITADRKKGLAFHLPDFTRSERFTPAELQASFAAARERHEDFLRGRSSILDVLSDPLDLISFAFLAVVGDCITDIASGVCVDFSMSIPAGCGLGGSAAAALSVAKAAAAFVGAALTDDELFRHAMECERLQHGNSSGADPYACLHGGCVRFRKSMDDGTLPVQCRRLRLPSFPFYLVNTGTPLSSTGECVEQVAHRFGNSSIWDDFESATDVVEEALDGGDVAAFRCGVRRNHQLLERIGVVPARVSRFIADVEGQGAAAKVSGGGSMRGDAGGIILVAADSAPVDLCRAYGYSILDVSAEPEGVRLVE